ncbi:MAG: hypothetical protein K2X81_00985 [Candidatus Obscuribacterales bacterium]|nr:hypothetical protein [Candidatus Obscuribacterales bacterium]
MRWNIVISNSVVGVCLCLAACTNSSALNGAAVSVKGYTATIDRTWNITDADIGDKKSFEMKVVSERAAEICEVVHQYPDITHVVLNETYTGPGDAIKESKEIDNLSSFRGFTDGAEAKRACRASLENNPNMGNSLTSTIYLTNEQRKAQEIAIQKRDAEIRENARVKEEAYKAACLDLEERIEKKKQENLPPNETWGEGYVKVKTEFVLDQFPDPEETKKKDYDSSGWQHAQQALIAESLRLPKGFRQTTYGEEVLRITVRPNGKVECEASGKDTAFLQVVCEAVRQAKLEVLPETGGTQFAIKELEQ